MLSTLKVFFGSHLYNLPSATKPVIGILTTNLKGKHDPYTQAIVNESRRENYLTDVFYPSDVSLSADSNGLYFTLRGIKYKKPPFDVVIPRIGSNYNSFEGTACLKQLELMGIPTINSSQAIINSENKWTTHQILAAHHIPQL